MARIPASAHLDMAPSGSVLLDGRVARIVGFDGGTVKLRFADGGTTGVALADFALRARALRPTRGSGVPGTVPLMPWQTRGQRARHVRQVLDGYAAGRKAALNMLENR